MRLAAIAILPLFAGLALAQTRTETRTTTTWNGTLVDATCQSTRVVRDESRQVNPDLSTTTRTTRTETFECPVTPTTSSFGMVTADGRFIQFDDASNSRVVQMVRGSDSLSAGGPIQVKVMGTPDGKITVIESLTPETSTQVRTVREVERRNTPVVTETIFDVRHGDDDGKLVVTETGVSYEDLSDDDHSRSWSYSEIKELKREGNNKIKIDPHSGDSFEFHVKGPGMPDSVYNAIGNHIAATRAR